MRFTLEALGILLQVALVWTIAWLLGVDVGGSPSDAIPRT